MNSKKELLNHVSDLNRKYCKNGKNKFALSEQNGGYAVVLTGKTYKRGSRTHWRKGSIGSGHVMVSNPGHTSIKDALFGIYKAEAKGWLQNTLKFLNKKK